VRDQQNVSLYSDYSIGEKNLQNARIARIEVNRKLRTTCPNCARFYVHFRLTRGHGPLAALLCDATLPVLWMTSCLHIMATDRRHHKNMCRPTQSDSAGGNSGPGRTMMSTIGLFLFTSHSALRLVAMSVHVQVLYVCLSVCPLAYLRNHVSELH